MGRLHSPHAIGPPNTACGVSFEDYPLSSHTFHSDELLVLMCEKIRYLRSHHDVVRAYTWLELDQRGGRGWQHSLQLCEREEAESGIENIILAYL